MRKLSAGVLGALTLAGIHISWMRFESQTYPYSVSAPSSYRHVLIQDAANRKVDYFFPALGSFTTNANIWAQEGDPPTNAVQAMEAIGGKHVRQVGWFAVAGRHLPLVRGEFHGLAGRWSIEQVDFVQGGRTWHLTASFDPKYKHVLPTLLHILGSFRMRG